MKYAACSICHYQGKTILTGSLGLEIFLWLLFPLGLFYTIWRRGIARRVCGVCGSNNLIPLGSPAAKGITPMSSTEYHNNEEAKNSALKRYGIYAALIMIVMTFITTADYIKEKQIYEMRQLNQAKEDANRSPLQEKIINIPEPTETKTCCETAGMGKACGYRVDSIYRGCERDIINNSEYDDETEQQKLQECRQSYEGHQSKIFTQAECNIIHERIYN